MRRLFDIIYYSQYYELKRSGRDPQKGRINGTLLSATIIILNIASIGLILNKYAPGLDIVQWIKRSFGATDMSGKSLGRIVGLISIALIGGLLWITVGSERSYNNIAERYALLPEEVQQRTIRQSLYIFFITFAIFLAMVFLL